MFGNVNILGLASALAAHASESHGVIGENIANADTPGYKAKRVESFAKVFARAQREAVDIRALTPELTSADMDGASSPNGNSVSLEQEMLLSTQAKTNHDMAIAIYRKSLDMLKMSMGKNI